MIIRNLISKTGDYIRIGFLSLSLIGLLYGGYYASTFLCNQGILKAPTIGSISEKTFEAAKSTVADNSAALLLARDSIGTLQTQLSSTTNAFKRLQQRIDVFGDTAISKTDAKGKTPNVITNEYVQINTEPFAEAEYYMILPAEVTVKNNWLEADISINKDSAKLSRLQLNGTVTVKTEEKRLNAYQVQRSVLFSRSNPYVSNWQDAYIEEPRYTKKGVKLKQAKTAAWAIPATFFFSYLSFRQGWIK